MPRPNRQRRRAIASSPENLRQLERRTDLASTHGKKNAMILAMQTQRCNISKACKAVGITRASHYNWLANDPEYARVIDEVEEEVVDQMEEDLRTWAIEDRDSTTLRWLLERRRRDRYASISRQEVTGANGGPVQTNQKLTVEAMKQEIPEHSLVTAIQDLVAERPEILNEETDD